MASAQTDVCVIGGGIAGLSAAAIVAERQRVVLLERESQLAYHATGRSAALFDETYGNRTIGVLTRASRAFYARPPQGFADVPLLKDRGSLFIATDAQRAALAVLAEEFRAGGAAVTLGDGAEARKRVPVLASTVTACLYQADTWDIDVGAVVSGFRKLLRARGGQIVTDAAVDALERDGNGWRVRAGSTSLTASVLIDAGGAWADEVARLAGVEPVGLQPRRRTALTVDLPSAIDARAWPFVGDVEERFYFRPESGRLLLSLADETLSAPCDAQPEDEDVAEAVDRVERATTLSFDRVVSAWAGLRTFVRDRRPVIGFDQKAPGFFWLAGQGGYGFQTAPAIARCVAALVRGGPLPGDIAEAGVTVATLGPGRLREVRPGDARQDLPTRGSGDE
jgi:D-arginine dehydrogenase